MGKRRNTRSKDPSWKEKEKTTKASSARSARTAAPASLNANKKASAALLPLPFPLGLSLPENTFLRNQPPHEKSFQAALDTAFEGFVVDSPAETSIAEESVQNALLDLDRAGFFRTDVTQPFGLGTKCAKTYVTRCLLGSHGTTYKYLGRMFSHPWDDDTDDDDSSAAVDVIRQLNNALTVRTAHYLSELDKIRCKRGRSIQGRAAFDICLVNRMEHSANLKEEPSLGEGSMAVSWHADSSLEHYSTIAVYQTIVERDDDSNNKDDGWSVALRVAHHAEGPTSSRRGTNMEASLVADTPTLAVSLPSGSAYYLLDDFNHHHQHAVLSHQGGDGEQPSPAGSIRFSSTHRLLRPSHNVKDMLGRCENVCASFHKKGTKLWRSEQLLLTELESEWIRQFYIQGQQHYDLLWKHWGDSIQQLLRYWSQLESRTKQTIDFLQAAAEGRCGSGIDGDSPSRAERKKRSKRKKALDVLEELLSRSSDGRTTTIQSLYESMAEVVGQRAEMRRLWKQREEDPVFRELDSSQRPLSVPFEFELVTKSERSAVSPMPGNLFPLAEHLVAWGQACVSGDARHFPANCGTCKVDPEEQKQATTSVLTHSLANEHFQSHSWQGWNDRVFGLEMQAPWASLLLQRKKTIETRAYDLPPALLGKRIDIFQSRQGGTVSALGNVVPLTGKDPAVIRVGWCKFTHVIKYEDAAAFDADQGSHRVTKGSSFYPFGKEKKGNVVYGWIVGEVDSDLAAPRSDPKLNTIVRRYRSLFELQQHDSKVATHTTNRKRRKRRRY